MRNLAAVTLMIGLASPALGQSGRCNLDELWSMGFGDSRYTLYVSDQQLKGSPQWSPQDGEPPLTMAQALVKAERWAGENMAEVGEAQLHSVTLGRIHCSGPDQWYYLVEFFAVGGKGSNRPMPYFVGVLMNGGVLAPKKESATITAPARLPPRTSALDSDTDLPPGFTCADARAAELARGAKVKADDGHGPASGLEFTRSFRGDAATVRYSCDGEKVKNRSVTLIFNSHDDAQRALARHREFLTLELGPACWDPQNLSPEQRALMPDGVPERTGLGRMQQWNVRPGVVAWLYWAKSPTNPSQWSVSIQTGEPIETHGAGPLQKVWELNTCAKKTFVADDAKTN